jgi:hypothetical protein
MKAKTSTPRRGKTESNTARHATQCTICKHAQKLEIEAEYKGFAAVPQVAEKYGVSDDSIYRHVEYFGLDAERMNDTEAVLKSIIARGYAQVKTIDSRLLIESIKELNRVQGKRQEEKPNENLTPDQKREKVRGWLKDAGMLQAANEQSRKLDEAVDRLIEKAAAKGLTITPEQARERLVACITVEGIQ